MLRSCALRAPDVVGGMSLSTTRPRADKGMAQRHRISVHAIMPDFDVEAFIIRLDRMGMKLTAVPLADGKLRVNRWCMLNATAHAKQIQDLWTAQVGNDQERIDILAAHLAKAASREAADCISSGALQIGSPSTAVLDATIGPDASADRCGAAGSDFGAPPQETPGVQMATGVPTVASSHPGAAPQRNERLPSPVLASILKVSAYRRP
jgi:hypothetical protein